MAQFRGIMQGQRGQVSRLGSKKSGLTARVDGWHSGIEIIASHVNGEDIFEVYESKGSKIGKVRLIGTLINGMFKLQNE